MSSFRNSSGVPTNSAGDTNPSPFLSIARNHRGPRVAGVGRSDFFTPATGIEATGSVRVDHVEEIITTVFDVHHRLTADTEFDEIGERP